MRLLILLLACLGCDTGTSCSGGCDLGPAPQSCRLGEPCAHVNDFCMENGQNCSCLQSLVWFCEGPLPDLAFPVSD
jgi:hypothetical protein